MKKGRFSRNSVNTLDQFTFTLKGNEKLSNNAMFAIKGGDGETDGGKPIVVPPPPSPSPTSTQPLILLNSNVSTNIPPDPVESE